ncbi:MAG: ABC transporter permease [Candidatus Glassbacteria bacterium]
MQIFRIALRNIWRQRRRTVLTILTMFGGFTLASISIAWSDGTYNSIINMFTRNRLGHIQVHSEGYLDRPSLYKTIDDFHTIGENIEALEGVESWAPRLYSAGLVSVGEKSAGTRIIGIDPAKENETTRFLNKITRGRGFFSQPSHEAILGKGLAEVLGAELGDTAIIISQAADGSIANDLYTVIGIYESGGEGSDRAVFYLHLQDAQELLTLQDRVHEIIVIANRLRDVKGLTREIESVVGDRGLSVAPWQEFARSFYNAMMADKQGAWIMIFVIMLIVAVGVMNTVLMTVMERRREYGLLRAVGTPPGQIVQMVLAETAAMAIMSIAVGILVSLIVNYMLSLHGIKIPEPITYGGVEFTTLKTELNLRSYLIPAVIVFFVGVVVSIFPAGRAARVAPAKAMRMG